MIQIPYPLTMICISLLWLLVRFAVYFKTKVFNWKREAQLLLVYICLVVVVRLTFFPFDKVDGKVQPLIFDPDNVYPFRLNFVAIKHIMDFESQKEAYLNLFGNMFLLMPLGIIFPLVDKKLNTPLKAIAAGIAISLTIEILQLPFFQRVTDINDLILNSAGYIAGYLICLMIKKAKKKA